MAVKIDAGKVKRGDLYFVDPFKVVVKENLRGRHKPVTKEMIVQMAISLANHGQRQPVECRRDSDHKLVLNLGFTRTNAARMLVEGFEHGGETYQDAEFRLKVQISECNDQVAFENNIVENAHRNATSAIDDAHNQNRLRDKYGYSNADIMRLYQYNSQNKVGLLQKLLQLDNATQDLVHNGMPPKAALELLKLPEDEREKAIAVLVKESKGRKIKGSAVDDAVRDGMSVNVLNDDKGSKPGTAETTEVQGAPKRSMSNAKKFLKSWQEGECPALASFATSFQKWLGGTIGDDAMDKAMRRIRDHKEKK